MDLLFSCPSVPANQASVLSGSLSLAIGPDLPFTRVYLDSFDWRLYKQGLHLVVEEHGGIRELILLDQEELGRMPLRTMPRFAEELPEEWRKRLCRTLDIRALLPQIELLGEIRLLGPRDMDGAPACISIETYATEPALPARLRIPPIFGKGVRRTLEPLMGVLELRPAEASLLDDLLRLQGRSAEDPSALRLGDLDPNLPAHDAARKVLLQLLAILEINLPGVLAEWDTEFLHDFRVAVRRSRSILGQLKQVFPARERERYARWLNGLGKLTGETRDLDVYLLHFLNLEQSLSEPMRADLAPLHEFLERHARESHQRINRSLRTREFSRRLTSWREFLESPQAKSAVALNADVPIGELAHKRIRKLHRRLLDEGMAIHEQTPASIIHELRKSAKKLRYLLEFFRNFYPAEKIQLLLKSLKELQEYLGEFQDTCVQLERLRTYGETMHGEGVSPACLLAIGALLNRLYARQQKLRDGFSTKFTRFQEESIRLKVRQWL